MSKPTSLPYFNKQNTPTISVSSNFDNNYGSKISSRFTPATVQENSTIIRGNLPSRHFVSQFNENGYPQYNQENTRVENESTLYPTAYDPKNVTTGETQRVHLRKEMNEPYRASWSKFDDKISVPVELSNQNLPDKISSISTLPKIEHNSQQLSQKFANSKHEEFNTDNIPRTQSPEKELDEKNSKIKQDTEDKIKPTTCYIVDNEYNNAEDERILNNAYDGYYAENERDQIYEESKEQKELEKSSKSAAIPTTKLSNLVQGKNKPENLYTNQTSNLQSHVYQDNRLHQVKDSSIEQPANNNSIQTPMATTEALQKISTGNNPVIDTQDETPLRGSQYQKSKTSNAAENQVLAESSISDGKPLQEYTNYTNQEENLYSETINYENQPLSDGNFDQNPKVNTENDFDPMQVNNYESNAGNYEAHIKKTINPTQEQGYEDYHETENNAESTVHPDETQIQEEGYGNYNESDNYEPGVNLDTAQLQENYETYDPPISSDTVQLQQEYENYESETNPGTVQLQEGYENYEPVTNPNTVPLQEDYGGYETEIPQDTVQTQEGYEGYEPGVNINQIPEAYGNYDESQSMMDQNNTLQYENYDNSQQQYDPNNSEGYNNNQEFDPNSATVYDQNNQMQSEMYNEESTVLDNNSTVQYSNDNQNYYAENQEYPQNGQEYQQDIGVYDPNIPQDNNEYQTGNIPQDGLYQDDSSGYPVENVPQDGIYQDDSSGYPVGNVPQDGIYQEENYQDNMYSEEGQMNYTTESNNIQNQELIEQENYVINDTNQSQMGLKNEPPVEKLTSNLSTLLDSDTSEQQSSDQQQAPSVRGESDFDFSETAAT